METWYHTWYEIFGLYYRYDSTVKFDHDYYKFKSLQVLIDTANILYTLLILLSLVLNTLNCVDLYLTVKNPFTKGDARSWKFGIIASLSVSMVGLIVYLSERETRI